MSSWFQSDASERDLMFQARLAIFGVVPCALFAMFAWTSGFIPGAVMAGIMSVACMRVFARVAVIRHRRHGLDLKGVVRRFFLGPLD